MKSTKRVIYLIGFILFAELSLLGFALVPPPYNIVFLFLNGLPLGMIWGIVFSYIEGRRATEILGVILCTSFIVSSGTVKSIGKLVMDVFGVSAFWMPFITGLLFLLPLVLFAFLLEKLPKPSKEDEKQKTIRQPMNKAERITLFKNFAFPLTLVILFYTLLTAIRDFRDNFARELWDALGYKESVSVYTLSEIPIAVVVLVLLGIIGNVRKNYKAFILYHILLVFGSLCIGLSTLGFQLGIISPVSWMIVSGFGMYLCYVPFNGLFFDRMIATFKITGNVGFLIYIADAFGYLGSIVILLYKNFGSEDLTWLSFFTTTVYVVSLIGVGVALFSYMFFRSTYKKPIPINSLIYEQHI